MGISIGSIPSSLGKNPVLYEYTSSGTWNKPVDANFYGALVVCIGAGGGGGSGRRGSNTTTRYGGTSGTGPTMVRCFFASSALSATHSITIGQGGTGGTAVTTNDTIGNNGGTGGSTIFQNLITAVGGQQGLAGSTSNLSRRAGGLSTSCTPNYGPVAITGGNGGGSTIVTDSNGSFNLMGICPGGGGCGRLLNVSGSGYISPGDGGGLVLSTGTVTGGSRGSGAGGNGNNGQSYSSGTEFLVFGLATPTLPILGTGGGGGEIGEWSATPTIGGGNGGNGGRCAGGGGGNASSNGANSGAGGNGGDGVCLVLELYGKVP